METIVLNATEREVVGKKVKSLRKEGKVPAVMYGNKIANKHLLVNDLEFSRVFEKAGENTIVELHIGKEKLPVLVYEIQNDPISGKPAHIDFLQVRMDEEVQANIPLEFVGESEAVKALGGVLVKNMDEIEVTCLPGNLPSEITVDLTKLATFEDDITIGDLSIPKGVEVTLEKETIIATVIPPRSEEELASLDEKVDADVTKVAGVVKETPAEGEKK